MDGADVAVLGDALVYWNGSEASGYRTFDGSPLWTAAPNLPDLIGTHGVPIWLGASDSTLFGWALGADAGYLVGVDGKGSLSFAHPVTPPGDTAPDDSVFQFCDASSSIALARASTDDRVRDRRGLDLANGAVLWFRLAASGDYTAITDGQRCYLLDTGSITALDLRTGAVVWHTADMPGADMASPLSLAGGNLLITNDKLQAFDTATGRLRWTAVNETTYIGSAVVGEHVYVFDGPGVVFAFNAVTGSQSWQCSNPLALDPGGSAHAVTATESLVAVPIGEDTPGVLTLRPSDGTPLWVYQPSSTAATTVTWKAARFQGSTVYATLR